MSKPPRVRRLAPKIHSVSEETPSAGPVDDFAEPEKAPEPKDPARMAAAIMIAKATESRMNAALVPGAVVVLRSPGDEWTHLLDDHWRRNVLGLNKDYDWQHWRNRRGDGPAELIRDTPWEDGKEDLRVTHNALASMATGHGLLAISLRPDECLPPEVRAAADAVFDVQPLSDSGLQELAVQLCGLPRYRIVPGWADGVTATALRVAYRPGQHGSDFIHRLRSIITAASGFRSSSGIKAPVASTSRWTLDNLHGMKAAVEWGRTLVRDLALYREGKIGWADCDRGALLAGPPGVGKTTFAAALAASADVPLISASYARWESGPDGKSSYSKVIPMMRSSFAEARRQAPCVLFIDEIDSLPSRGDAGHNESWFTPITNALLAELDGLEGRPGVVVVAATNHAQRIDPALRRAGRLDRTIELTLPDEAGLSAILGEHLGVAADGMELPIVARRLIGRTGADVEMLVRGARRRARSEGRPIGLGDLLEELAAGHRVRSPALHYRIAVHEAGHAVHTVLRDRSALDSVSLVPVQMGSAGGAWTRIDYGEAVERDFDVIIESFMAGRAAEVVALGDPSSGCGGPRSSDLGMATFLAVTTEIQAGLGPSGLTWRGEVTAENLDGYLRSDPRLAHHVEGRLQRLYDAAVATLTRHKAALVAVADALIVAEVLSGAEVAAIVARHPSAGEALVIPPWPLRIVGGAE